MNNRTESIKNLSKCLLAKNDLSMILQLNMNGNLLEALYSFSQRYNTVGKKNLLQHGLPQFIPLIPTKNDP